MTRINQLALSFVGAAAMIAGTAFAEPVAEGGKKLTTALSGANEVPPADPDGSGTAKVTINAGQGRVCWEITTANIDPVLFAHIHSAHAGQNGPIVIFLSAAQNDTATGCASITGPGGGPIPRSLLDAIRKAPQGYYVNVHTTVYPGGAIRGQLG